MLWSCADRQLQSMTADALLVQLMSKVEDLQAMQVVKIPLEAHVLAVDFKRVERLVAPRVTRGLELAERASRLRWQAGCGRRHRIFRDPGDPVDRAAGGAAHSVPADTQFYPAGEECADRSGTRGQSPRRLSGACGGQ